MSRTPYIVSRAPGRLVVRPEPRVQWRVAVEGGVTVGVLVALGMAAFTIPDLVAELRADPADAIGRLAVYLGFGGLVALALVISRGFARHTWSVDGRRGVFVVDMGRRDGDEGVDVPLARVRGLRAAPRSLGRWVPELELADGQRLALGPAVRQRAQVEHVVAEACALVGLEVAECA